MLVPEYLFRLTRGRAVVETHYLRGESDPILRFYPGSTLNSHLPTSAGPSLSCVELMLLDVGFRKARLVRTYGGDDDRAIFVAEE